MKTFMELFRQDKVNGFGPIYDDRIYYIIKYYLNVILTLKSNFENTLNEIEYETESLLTYLTEEDDDNDDDDKYCYWCDDEVEDCQNLKVTDTNYCSIHLEKYNEWMFLLKVYINFVLGNITKEVVKQINTKQKHWKDFVIQETGLSKYKLNNLIKKSKEQGMNVNEIALKIDELDD